MCDRHAPAQALSRPSFTFSNTDGTERLRAIAAEDPEGEVFADLADEHMGELLQRLEDPARSTFTGAWCELYGPPDCPFDNPCD